MPGLNSYFPLGRAVGPIVGASLGMGLVESMCMVVQAGKSSGVLSDEQIGTIFAKAAGEIRSAVPEGTSLTTAAADCEAAFAKLKPGC